MTSSDETLAILPQAQPSNKYLQWARSHYSLIQAYLGALEDVDRLNFLRGYIGFDVPKQEALEPNERPISRAEAEAIETEPERIAESLQDSGQQVISDSTEFESRAGPAKSFMGGPRRAVSQTLNSKVTASRGMTLKGWNTYGSFAGFFVVRPLVKRLLRLHVRNVLQTLRVEYRTERTGINPSTVYGLADRELLGRMISDVSEGLEHHTRVAGLPGSQGKATGFLGGAIPLGGITSLIVGFWGPIEGGFRKLFLAPTDGLLSQRDLTTTVDQLFVVGGYLATLVVVAVIGLFVLAQSMAFSVKQDLLQDRSAYQLERDLFDKLDRETTKEAKDYQWQRFVYPMLVLLVGFMTWLIPKL